MAQLAIAIPDALLPELGQIRSQLPLLLAQWINSSRSVPQDSHQTPSQELLSFLIAQPTLQDILNLKSRKWLKSDCKRYSIASQL